MLTVRYKIKNYGFVLPEITSDNYVLGGQQVPEEVLRVDGQWDDFLPVYEPQFGGDWDSFGCVAWGTENALEILTKSLTGYEDNFSERYIYILAGIRPPGADPHFVAEVIRKKGLIPDGDLPMTKTYEEFIKPDPMESRYLKIGGKWLKTWLFKHEWVFKPGDGDKIEKMKKALQFSPLGVSVWAWSQNAEGLYYKYEGERDNHWVVCYGYEEGEYWKVFDSYDHSEKKLTWDFDFGFAKRYWLGKNPGNVKPNRNWLTEILQSLWEFVLDIFKKRGN